MVGQDKCIYKQYLLVKKQWYLPDGATKVTPKDEGHGIMLSSFILQEFGYRFELTPEHLNKVNEYRRMKKYKDEGAAMEVFKMIEKEELTNSPFVREFNYGMNFDGY